MAYSISDVVRANLSRSLFIALVTPFVLLAAVGATLLVQVERLSAGAAWVSHSGDVIAKTTELLEAVDIQEGAIRGFVNGGDRQFLVEYERARPLDLLAEVRALTVDNPTQQARLDRVERRYERWRSMAPRLAEQGANRAEIGSTDATRERASRLNDLRETLRSVLDAERSLREERVADFARSRWITRALVIGLFTAAAGLVFGISRRQLRRITTTYTDALAGEHAARAAVEERDWLTGGALRLSQSFQGEPSLEQLGERMLSALASHCQADVGAIFTRAGTQWRRRAGFALDPRVAGTATFADGEGAVGRAAVEQRLLVLKDVPENFLKVRSGTGEHDPIEVVLFPAAVDRVTTAVVELGFLRPAVPRILRLLENVGPALAQATRSVEHQLRLRELLEESQRQGEELQAQQEELHVVNEEIEEQRNSLRAAHDQLSERRDELEVANARLLEQTTDLESAQRALVDIAAEARSASRYKSEFLANMSHELRTPLNSSLILAKLLTENKEGNLTEEQVKFAGMIYASGNDLLALINDVLDLSKVEAGRVEVHSAPVAVARVVDPIARMFEPVARQRGLEFDVRVEDGCPASVDTDAQRVGQILKNLVSNALKFTDKGSVSLRARADGGSVAFDVVDTGPGIAEDQRERIFEAFRQADSGASRKGGGTGLGLSISRQLARLLRGTITVESEIGRGSTFTLRLPLAPMVGDRPAAQESAPQREPVHAPPRRTVADIPAPLLADDRDRLDGRRPVVLVVEDDLAFAQILVDLVHERDFQCIVAHDAESGIACSARFSPSAILLDLKLPDQSGLSVLERLKREPRTRHVPVHVVSVTDQSQSALAMGAVGYLVKPARRERLVAALAALEARFSRRVGRLLIVEDDPAQREALGHLLGGADVEIVTVGTVADALAALAATTFDCMVTDLSLPDASGFDLLDRMAKDDRRAFPPVIVYTGHALTADQEQCLRRRSNSIIVKGVRSPERLVAEVALFLHQIEAELPPERQRMIQGTRDREAAFEGRTFLVVEDDVRNVFALSSLLERKGAKVVVARNGREGVEALEAGPVDLVLMDVMMPEMDGLEAIRTIRKNARYADLPIIALTAKAMRDDREQCLLAGANDYVPKPLDVDRLLSLVRVWMPR